MAVIKNKKTGIWEVRTYYKDMTGERKQKTKRGFAKKSEALEWERNFKLKENQSISMSFQSFIVATLLGLDTSDYSFEYIAGWNGKDNLKALSAAMKQVQDTANQMYDNIIQQLDCVA